MWKVKGVSFSELFKVYSVLNKVNNSHNCHGLKRVPSGQILADSVGNPRGFQLLVEGINMEIWAVSETRIQVQIKGKFLTRG